MLPAMQKENLQRLRWAWLVRRCGVWSRSRDSQLREFPWRWVRAGGILTERKLDE